MKIKGVIKDLNLKHLKSDNSKNISRNFSGAVVASVFSVQIVPCYSLYFSRSISQSVSQSVQSLSLVRLFATP